MKTKWRMPHPATMFYAADDGSGLSFMDMRYLWVESDIAANR